MVNLLDAYGLCLYKMHEALASTLSPNATLFKTAEWGSYGKRLGRVDVDIASVNFFGDTESTARRRSVNARYVPSVTYNQGPLKSTPTRKPKRRVVG